jgi:hypothetical protein
VVDELALWAPERLDDSYRRVPGIADDRHPDAHYTTFPDMGTDEVEPELVVVAAAVFVLDDLLDDALDDLLLPPHAATPTEIAASAPTSTIR